MSLCCVESLSRFRLKFFELWPFKKSEKIPVLHNDVRDLSASLMKDVCPNVIKEPVLQPLTGETLQYRTASTDYEARLDISAEGFWGHRFRKVYFDVCVFCPLAPTNKSRTLEACYRDNELKKKKSTSNR